LFATLEDIVDKADALELDSFAIAFDNVVTLADIVLLSVASRFVIRCDSAVFVLLIALSSVETELEILLLSVAFSWVI
jgi:hypothetical protein